MLTSGYRPRHSTSPAQKTGRGRREAGLVADDGQTATIAVAVGTQTAVPQAAVPQPAVPLQPTASSSGARQATASADATADSTPRPRAGGNRAQIAIISGAAIALLVIVTLYAVRDVPSVTTRGCATQSCTTRPGAAPSPALTGRPSVSLLASPGYALDGPTAVAAGGGSLWITNVLGSTVTSLPLAAGRKVMNLPAAQYGFDGPNAIAIGGNHVWVANTPANSVTELSTRTGAPIRVLGTGYGFAGPYALQLYGHRLWVADAAINSVTEISATSGARIRTVTGGAYRFDNPYALAVADGRLWVANSGGGSVTEISAATGRLIRVVSGGRTQPTRR